MQGGVNLPKVRDYNEGLVLETIRVGRTVSRAEITSQTGLTAQTVSNIVKRLQDQDLVLDLGSKRKGKSGTLLRVNPSAGYAVGVQIDGDETSLVIINLDGAVVSRMACPTLQEHGPAAVINLVASSVDRLIESTSINRRKVLGVGVACPGPLDHARGIVYEPSHLLGWREVHLKEALEEETDYPVIVDNDATAAAVGERWSGKTQGVRNFAFVYMGIGLGAGLYLGGNLHRGSTTSAGEFGHLTLDPEGPECFCGSRGCIEVFCAPRSVILSVRKRLRSGERSSLGAALEGGAKNVDFKAVCRSALTGDALALEEIKRSARMLGIGVVGLINLLDVEMVVLGGRAFRDVGSIYRQEIERVLGQRAIAWGRRNVRVELSERGEDAGAVGAASLLLHARYAPRLSGLREAYRKDTKTRPTSAHHRS